MYKKEITPLPSGMMDAFTKSLNTQLGNYDTAQEASAPEAPSEEASIPEQNLEEDAKSLTAVRDHGQGKSQYKADNEKSTKEKTKEVEALVSEDNTNDKSDDGEGLDKVQPKAVKKKFKDRKDKDLDNDGDVDDSDEYLHKRRKAISKALESKKAVEESSVDGRTKEFKEKVKALAYAKGSDDLQEKENSYTVVHAKKGKVVVTAPTSYAAAQKAAKQWKLKSTAGVDSYIMEDTDVKKSEREALDEGKMKEFHDFMQKGKSPEFIAKKMGLDLKTVKQLMDHLDEASTSTGDVEQAKRDLEHAKLQKKIKNVKYDSVKGTVEESVELDESMDDTLKRLKKMGGSVYGDKLTSKSDKTPAKLASQSRGKKTVYFVVTDDGYTEYKDLGAVKKAWNIAGNTADTKIALDLMSKQGDGDAIDMILNKYKISIDKLDKIVKNNLGAKSAADFLGESVELDEALKTTHVVIDTADGNKIVSSATNEKQAKSSIVSAERPPLNIKDKKTLKVVQLKKPVSLNKDILGTTLKEEAVQLDEVRGKLNAKGEIEMTKANFAKVHKDYKTKIKGQPFAMQIDPKSGGSALFPVKFIKEEVALDEAKRVITKAVVVKLLIKRGNNPKVAKDMVEKEFDSAIKRHPDATASRIAEVISVVAEEVALDEAYQVYVKSRTAKSGWIAQGQPHKTEADAKKDAKSFGGVTKIVKEEVALDEAYQQFTDKTPNWGEDQALTYGRKKGYKEVAVMGDGKGVHAMVLFALNSEDKKFVKGANVKSSETVFRYTTKISIAGDIFPLVKVNIAKGIFYPLTQESSDGSIETAKFETKGVKLKFFRSLEGVKLESIEEARMKEGNTFTKALAAARLNGDDEFIVSGKKYKVTEHAEELDEAMGNFSVPIPKQTLNGKKLGGGQPIVVKARTAREAITKAAKQLDVDFKFLKTGKVVKEAVDSADQDDVVATKGDKESAKMHIIVQLRKAADVKGNLDIVFADGKKQKLPANIIKIALDKFNSFRKPATKEKLVTAMSKSYKDMLNALKTIKEYSE